MQNIKKVKGTSWRPKANKEDKNIGIQFANWLSQVVALIKTKIVILILGRGTGKTSDIAAQRLIDIVYDMPGAPCVWVSDTYANLQKNVLPSLMEGLERLGYHEGVHYVLGKAPLVYSEKEKEDLPPEIREHFWKPYNKLASYKHTMIWFTGLNITFGSLDRPASLAGRSYVHCFGDEVKYFAEHKIANLLKAVRGYKVKYGNSIYYRGQTFTTDMPNPGNIGEHDWVLKQASRMRKSAIMQILRVALVMNECLHEWIYFKQRNDKEEAAKKFRTYKRWEHRWNIARRQRDASTFFFVGSSYINADILTEEWFTDQMESDLGDTETAVLSLKPSLNSGERFYANISEAHFFDDGLDPVWSERFGITDTLDCRELKYLNRNRAIDLGIDFGNMMSMTIGQEKNPKEYRILKFMYTLSPDWIRELADNFLEYFSTHKEKKINMYYDRAGNNLKEVGQDLATDLKNAIEIDKDGKRTGWKITLMSLNQGNIPQTEEYNFMQLLLSGTNPKLPKVLIDKYQCKPLKESLQLAKTKIRTNAKGFSIITKDKSSEGLPIHRLPMESTNPSDSFKYLMMRRVWRNAVKSYRQKDIGTTSVR